MTDRELLELIAAQVGSLTNEMQEGFNKVDTEMKEMKEDIKVVKERIIKIEDDHGKKLTVLLDGHKQNTEILERVEKEVSKHEEIILRRVK